jgi:hypothetical protein
MKWAGCATERARLHHLALTERSLRAALARKELFNGRAFELAIAFENRRLDDRRAKTRSGDQPTENGDEREAMLPRLVSAAAFNS